jgi:lysophospholipase L1-like esterase
MGRYLNLFSAALAVPVLAVLCLPCKAAEPASCKFALGAGLAGFTQISPDTVYTSDLGYGFDLGTSPATGKPFFFSVRLPEGNYTVKLTLGDLASDSDTTIKAESRRLMFESIKTKAGEPVTRSFTVNIRQPNLPGGDRVKLKPREQGVLHWDDKLTLEFNGPHPGVMSIEIEPAPPETITVYLAGDSTVTDQPSEPYNSWGQMLPRFFRPTVAVANHAESGETLKSFTGERRINKILSTIKAGDYLFIQFGHNDQKDKSSGAGAFTTYTDSLKHYAAEARARQAVPVFITPVSRRSFGPDGKIENNLGDFPEAVRRVANEENVPLIDLNSMSQAFYEAIGSEESRKAFAPGDNTHHNNYGSYELAKCVVKGIRDAKLDLAKHLLTDVPAFDPSKPDAIDSFDIPPSPHTTTTKPEGN